MGKISSMTRIADNPYPGSRAFRQADRDHFSGRAAEAADIADLWQVNRLTIVSGPVASGKTSLLQAGVYPLIARTCSRIFPPGILSYGVTFPFAALPEHNSYTLAVLRSWSPEEEATRLAGLTVSDFVRRRTQRADGVLFAAIDQVEDLLLGSASWIRKSWRRQFFRELAQAIENEPRLHLLLVTRDEGLDLLSAAIGDGARYTLTPLDRQGAVDAITMPLTHTGRSFAEGAPDRLVADLQTSRIGLPGGNRYVAEEFVEPALLQIVCRRLWRNLPREVSVITARDIRAFGDVDVALAEHCAHTTAAVAAQHDRTSQRLRSWLLDSFVADDGTRRALDEGEICKSDIPVAIVRTLLDRHLLTNEPGPGLPRYKLLSDRLIEPLRKAADERPPPSDPLGDLRAAGQALALGALDLSEQYAEQVLAAKPDMHLRAKAHSLLGNLAHEREKPAEAEPHYRQAASLFEAVHDTGTVARQLAAVGQVLLAQGRTVEAVDELRAAVERAPNDLLLQTELALALWQLDEGRAAVAVLTSVLAIDGGNTEALRARGEILADLGNAREAMLDLDRQAVRDRPSTSAARGLALAELGDHRAANLEIHDAMARAPRNGPVLLYAARASALGGDEISSRELAKHAIDATDPPLSPQHREVAQRLAGHK
jgi:tetratricopeptide (TPR) repeat protein